MSAYLLTVLGIQENPSKLNDLGRVLGNVYSMLVAGCCNVDNDISVEVPLLGSRQSYRHRIWLYFCSGEKGCRVSNLGPWVIYRVACAPAREWTRGGKVKVR